MTAELTKCMGGDTVGENEKTTLELIHNAAKAEFMEKGFREASLRNIAKSARCDDRSALRVLRKQRRTFQIACQ